MTHNNSQNTPGERPEFDPQRSSEIRDLLVRTVAGTPRPRVARLSRTAFSLAASAALLVAIGIGAGGVMAYDHLSGNVIAQEAPAPAGGVDEHTLSGEPESAPFTQTGDAAASTSAAAGALTPVLHLNGEIGYAYGSDLQAAQLTHLDAASDAAESAPTLGRVAIYRADGVSVLGYFDPAGLIP